MEGNNRTVFPYASLAPAGGGIRALIAENHFTGLKRRLSWSFTVNFKPFEYCDREVSPSLTIDFVPGSIRDWRDLVGLRADGDYGQNGIEASFYVWEHDYCSSFHLYVLERKDTSFLVEMSAVVEFSEVALDDAVPTMPVKARCWLPFEGLALSLDTPASPDERAAREAAVEFVDLSAFTQDRADPTYFLPRL